MTLHHASRTGQQGGDGLVRVPDAVLAAITARAGEADRHSIEGVRRLSKLFTVGRGELTGDYLADPGLRRAYLQYFLPVNFAKVACLLREMPSLPLRPLRILDLGSGPGVASLAVRGHIHRRQVAGQVDTEVLAIDQGHAALQEARALWAITPAVVPGIRLSSMPLDVERPGKRAPWKTGRFDVIIAANSVNELFRSTADPITRRVKLLQQLLDSMSDDGTLMIIEPALRETTRDLHLVRDKLLSGSGCNVYSPCLHDRPCPALVHPDDWCHEERPWSPPAIVREIDRKVGFIKDALKFSYLLLRKDGRTILERAPAVYRVVSEKMVMKGEQRVWLCNEMGRQLVGRLDKASSLTNEAFDQWHRGAIVRLDEIERHGAIGRVAAGAKAELLRPADR